MESEPMRPLAKAMQTPAGELNNIELMTLYRGECSDIDRLNELHNEVLRRLSALSTVEKERDGLRGHLRRIVDTAQYADFSATSERVFSELDVFLDEARKALETK